MPEQPDRTWLGASVTLAPKAVESCSKALKILGKCSSLHFKKFFFSSLR